MSTSLQVRLLGPFEVVAAEARERQQAPRLLALLALRGGRVVGVDSLIDALWGDDLPAAPRNAVQHHVTRLRAALGPDAIAARRDGYALTDAVVDAFGSRSCSERRAPHCARAMPVQPPSRCPRAGPLARPGVARAHRHGLVHAEAAAAGVASSSTRWKSSSRRRSRSETTRARRRTSSGARGEPVPRAAVGAADAGALPQRPPGRRARGLTSEARRVLSEQMALEPGPELRRLQEAILAHDPAIAPVPVAPRRRGNLPAPSTSFVDREAGARPGGRAAARAPARDADAGRPGSARAGSRSRSPARSRANLRARRVARRPRARRQRGRRRPPRRRSRRRSRRRPACSHGRAPPRQRRDPRPRRVRARPSRRRRASSAAVLPSCPGVRVLATSREVLHVPGEVRVTVEPLALPDPDRPTALPPRPSSSSSLAPALRARASS